jgi:hypothetical protein
MPAIAHGTRVTRLASDAPKNEQAMILFESQIPADHPEKYAIEQAIRDELTSFAWRWQVRILCSANEGWWAVLVNSRRFEASMFLTGPEDQRSEAIRARLRRRLRDLDGTIPPAA